MDLSGSRLPVSACDGCLTDKIVPKKRDPVQLHDGYIANSEPR